MKGKFVTVEGSEGVGKTTNMAFISQWLAERNIPHVTTREPGGTPYAEKIRSLLLEHNKEPVDSMTELLLIFACRAQHLAQVIRPALAAGKWVLCDRFTDATYAYQGGGRGVDKGKIAILESLVQDSVTPDLTFLLDIDPELGLQRATRRGKLDRFEVEQLAFFERVRETYLARAKSDSRRYQVVNAGAPLSLVQEQIAAVLESMTVQ